jgi:menaquinone-dependent protoporphyrinogen IX oxidase
LEEKKTLVAYVTAGGATAAYASIIADTLRSRGHDVTVVDLKRDDPGDLSPFECVVVGMGVRMFMVYRKGKSFLARRDLAGKKLGIFLSSGMAIEDPTKARERFLAPLIERYGLKPLMYDSLPGKMPAGGGKLTDKSDPNAARGWAESFADRVEAGMDSEA